jgi:hypothetical protein
MIPADVNAILRVGREITENLELGSSYAQAVSTLTRADRAVLATLGALTDPGKLREALAGIARGTAPRRPN